MFDFNKIIFIIFWHVIWSDRLKIIMWTVDLFNETLVHTNHDLLMWSSVLLDESTDCAFDDYTASKLSFPKQDLCSVLFFLTQEKIISQCALLWGIVNIPSINKDNYLNWTEPSKSFMFPIFDHVKSILSLFHELISVNWYSEKCSSMISIVVEIRQGYLSMKKLISDNSDDDWSSTSNFSSQ